MNDYLFQNMAITAISDSLCACVKISVYVYKHLCIPHMFQYAIAPMCCFFFAYVFSWFKLLPTDIHAVPV